MSSFGFVLFWHVIVCVRACVSVLQILCEHPVLLGSALRAGMSVKFKF